MNLGSSVLNSQTRPISLFRFSKQKDLAGVPMYNFRRKKLRPAKRHLSQPVSSPEGQEHLRKTFGSKPRNQKNTRTCTSPEKWLNNFLEKNFTLKAGLVSGFLFLSFRSVSSVGLEHCLDRAGVVGSNPIHSTQVSKRRNQNSQIADSHHRPVRSLS